MLQELQASTNLRVFTWAHRIGAVNRLAVSTVVYEPADVIYEFLLKFPNYTRYSEYLTDVRTRRGDGGAGTEYALRFAWWKLEYTAHSLVFDVTPDRRIDWRITKDVDAEGCWRIEPLDSIPDDAPADVEAACEVVFEVWYDPQSADDGMVDLPRFVSIGWVVDKAIPLIRTEAEAIFERAVADLEGRRRPIDLDISTES